MKKLFVLLISFFSTLFFSQNTRFIYEVSMKKDSTNRGDVKTELAYLDVVGQKSMFYAEKRIKRDSIMQVVFQSQGSMRPDRSAMQNLRSDINYTIEKNLADQKVEFRDRIAMDIYSYNEDRPMNWKIQSETAKIGDYKAQKAELDFGGRHWIAWFTQDIPVMDGPYKFHGLPGLIIKIEDSKGDYSFLLKETKKNAQIANLTNMGNIIKVKRADYLKQMEKYKKDPSSFFSQSGGGHSFGPGNTVRVGMNTSNPDVRKRMEERIKEEQKTNNNPIELK
ncbi:MAG: GLPGLI family protein [Bacteroidetes bacterium]|jgi:GLPGLI family protein|nr:GLPGLI family protein [Bacteroidota bacterium]